MRLFEKLASGFRQSYGWWVVGVGCVLLLLMFGTRLSFGVYIKPMGESFGASRASISGSQSLYMIVYAVCALIAGALTDRHGPKKVLIGGSVFMGVGMLLASRITSVWQYYLSYGILVAAGSGAMYVPITGTVSKFFSKRRNFAVGITVSGAGLGQYLIPPFMQRVVEGQGWQTAFLYTGMLLLAVGILLPWLVLRGRGLPDDVVFANAANGGPTNHEAFSPPPASPETFPHYTLREAMATTPFWTYFSLYFIMCFVFDGVIFVHVYPYLTDIGYGGQTAASALAYLGLISTITMVLFGPLGDRLNKRILLTGFFVIHVLLIMWLMHLKGKTSLYLFTACYGIMLGAAWPLTVSIVSDIFGSGSVSSILGACTMGFGIAGLIAPWFAGHIHDRYHSYDPVFYFMMLLSLASAVLAFYTRRPRRD